MSSQHQRITEILYDYWNELRAGRAYPDEDKINPDAIASIWDYCFSISIIEKENTHSYRYDYLGSGLIDAFGDDITKKDISKQLLTTSNAPLVASFNKVVANKQAINEESQFTNSLGMVIKYRSCILPLGAKDDKVDYLIGAMKWRAF
jgi:hypothetical protein